MVRFGKDKKVVIKVEFHKTAPTVWEPHDDGIYEYFTNELDKDIAKGNVASWKPVAIAASATHFEGFPLLKMI